MRDHQMHGLILMNSGVRNKSASPILTRFIPKWEMGDLTLNMLTLNMLNICNLRLPHEI